MERALATGKAGEQQGGDAKRVAPRPPETSTRASQAEGWPPTTMPDPGDEERLRRLRRTLTEIFDSHGGRGTASAGSLGLLDAALLDARTELLTGGERLDEATADFIYLMVLPLAGREAAELASAEATARLASSGPLAP
jgi:hypothetical protein